MTKIALVDDNRNYLVSLSMALEAEGLEVDCYSDGQAALRAFDARRPDLVVLDLKMPRMDGMELLDRLRRKSSLPVIILSSRDSELDEALGLRMGADDYLRKSSSQRVLIARIRALLRRQTAWAAATDDIEDESQSEHLVMTRGPLVMDPARHEVTWKGETIWLTVAEFRLVRALANQPGVVVSRHQLLEAIGDEELELSDRAIDAHIKRVRRKMHKKDPEFSAIETIYRVGYRYNM
ncbi:MAG: response regulator transcription factor [Limimaricola soesokkakensis]|uniref:response regulator transcription factor n=1 Tax=Limimaricola soesokkakensis TaxID=1343159 RepID=UPI0040582E66